MEDRSRRGVRSRRLAQALLLSSLALGIQLPASAQSRQTGPESTASRTGQDDPDRTRPAPPGAESERDDPEAPAAPQFVEDVVVVGSRAQPRSVTESTVPIDVVRAAEVVRQGGANLADQLRVLLPSFHVNPQDDGGLAAVVRPASLRGLAPDHTLVLVNGKRRHRGAVISWLGNGVADGAQGPDISTIPGLALRQIEVLRDGAAAKYGSDAIAGVLNFLLRDDRSGGRVEVRSQTHGAGDGRQYAVAANAGLPLGGTGFANLSLEYGNTASTDRSVQRADAARLVAAGNRDVGDPAQQWGSLRRTRFQRRLERDAGVRPHCRRHVEPRQRRRLRRRRAPWRLARLDGGDRRPLRALEAAEVDGLLAEGVTAAGDLSNFRFFTNDLETRTQGVDVVAAWTPPALGGATAVSVVFNHTDTAATDFNPALLNPDRIVDRIRLLEEALPDTRWSAAVDQAVGRGTLLARLSYYGGWYDRRDTHRYRGKPVVDLELAWPLGDAVALAVGARNVLDT